LYRIEGNIQNQNLGYITTLENNISMSEIENLNNIIKENECVLKDKLSKRFENLSSKITK